MRIHNQNYGCYKDLKGSYTWTEGSPIELLVDHVQGDPYAAASRFRARLPLKATGIPSDLYENSARVVALCDYINRKMVTLVRQWRLHVADSSGSYHGPKGGDFNIYKPRQQILERSSCVILGLDGSDPSIEIRFSVTLPAFGRSINGEKAQELLIKYLPQIMDNGLLWHKQDHEKVRLHLKTMEVQDALRAQLEKMNLVAFVGNGSILPRASGADPAPMKSGAVVFQSPPGMEVVVETGILDEAGEPISITGMGIPRGVTVVTGGGFHGKSTLLEALQFGIYNVIPGDGREHVVTEPNAFKIRAEDGRNVVNTDITPFISELPGGRPTSSFTTEDASGSTSMAANIQESIEAGATALIIDEDTSATNFLVRDNKMFELVRTEPITPLVSKVTALFEEKNVSTIIVVGGCGDYLTPANTVIGMESYHPHDWTVKAHAIAAKYPNAAPVSATYGSVPDRILTLPTLGDGDGALLSRGIEKIIIREGRGRADANQDSSPEIDLSALEQFVEEGQTSLCVNVLKHIKASPPQSVGYWVRELQTLMAANGTNIANSKKPFGNLVKTRPLEMLAAVNRVRGLRVQGGISTGSQVRGFHMASKVLQKLVLRR